MFFREQRRGQKWLCLFLLNISTWKYNMRGLRKISGDACVHIQILSFSHCKIFRRSSRVGIFGSGILCTFQNTPIVGFRTHLAISLKNTSILDNQDRSENGSV
jgi:hypothetical protein